jgi:hypothetical protein
MRTVFLSVFCLLLFAGALAAQDARAVRNVMYLEMGGNAGLVGINYERLVGPGTGVRVGLGFDLYMENCHEVSHIFLGTTLSCDDDMVARIVLLMANQLLGSGRHKLDLGGGIALGSVWGEYQREPVASGHLSGTGAFGYRYERGAFRYRAALTPSYGHGSNAPPYRGAYGTIGVSLGLAF